MKSIIKLKNVSKFYYNKGIIASGFTKINLEFNIGEFVAITGESGSGKSTLLNVISGLDTYEEGEMYINGEETSHYIEKDFEEYRRKYIANIYQNFNLVNSYSVYQNIELVLLLNGYKKSEVKKKVIDLIKKVDLYKFRNTKVSKLSGGQKQRVSIARALAKECPILIADEPTGNLDSNSARSIIKLLSEIAKDKLVIIVTHNYEQVSEYVTRKIKMHDGKVLEDKEVKKYDEVENVQESKFKNISLFNKIKLGVRNAFNVVPKFVLLLLVFIFVVWALLGEYGAFKKLEYDDSNSGYNTFFTDISDTRVVIKKKDKTPFSEEDYEKINKIPNIKKVIQNDILIDTQINLIYNDYWVNGNVRALDNFEGNLDIGRMPENDDEFILESNEDSYLFYMLSDEILGKRFSFWDDQIGDKSENTIKLVGIKYTDSWDDKFYVSDTMSEVLNRQMNRNNTEVKVLFKGKYVFNSIMPNKNVPKGKVFISEDYDYACKNYDCAKEKPKVKLEVDNINFKDSLTLEVSKTFNEKNIKKRLGLKDYYKYNSMFFVNEEDYNSLYDRDYYQSSIYVEDFRKIDETIKELNDMDIDTLKIKDTIVIEKVSKIIQIFRTVVTTILVIVLFFISYFVIKLILKSRNVYYTTIRMLGGSKKTCRDLLIIELLVVSNIAFLTFVIATILNNKGIINNNYFAKINQFLELRDFIVLYIIILTMSLLISLRYSRKLFKNSVMVTLSEEV